VLTDYESEWDPGIVWALYRGEDKNNISPCQKSNPNSQAVKVKHILQYKPKGKRFCEAIHYKMGYET
jgi:hypothetical protein